MINIHALKKPTVQCISFKKLRWNNFTTNIYYVYTYLISSQKGKWHTWQRVCKNYYSELSYLPIYTVVTFSGVSGDISRNELLCLDPFCLVFNIAAFGLSVSIVHECFSTAKLINWELLFRLKKPWLQYSSQKLTMRSNILQKQL